MKGFVLNTKFLLRQNFKEDVKIYKIKLFSLVIEESMPDYDEATKALIAAADKARQDFDEADKQIKELEAEQR